MAGDWGLVRKPSSGVNLITLFILQNNGIDRTRPGCFHKLGIAYRAGIKKHRFLFAVQFKHRRRRGYAKNQTDAQIPVDNDFQCLAPFHFAGV